MRRHDVHAHGHLSRRLPCSCCVTYPEALHLCIPELHDHHVALQLALVACQQILCGCQLKLHMLGLLHCCILTSQCSQKGVLHTLQPQPGGKVSQQRTQVSLCMLSVLHKLPQCAQQDKLRALQSEPSFTRTHEILGVLGQRIRPPSRPVPDTLCMLCSCNVQLSSKSKPQAVPVMMPKPCRLGRDLECAGP